MYSEDELLPISALQHFLFCERQCALIHLEQLWAENRFTIEGQHLHKKAHAAGTELRDGVTITRGLMLRSFRLGLYGKADIVECSPHAPREEGVHRAPREEVQHAPREGVYHASREEVQHASREGVHHAEHDDYTAPAAFTPVEYKRGKPKPHDADRVQLCAQALCLEEMLGVRIESGALFYGQRRRRTPVNFDLSLRQSTETTAARLHAMIASGQTPRARREPKCEHCSLLNLCIPDAMTVVQSMSGLVDRAFRKHLLAEGPIADGTA